ncbi:tRNA (adenosine(37)-N6)-threonylcarbamoyltransferase complex dimerization subunit type 1 TsaB [Levilactobacillus brevis]|uniref:Universal bacterial protein YeaZ n=1 Tax=Levilactobacillus brevis ATCC 14869 = DSM 20054 TaxID=649758 RepID=U2PAS2_LEVBR|nr:tRNA (adenosine(37)-N6)-threonylcarbamoyltransferase complex dimerization subunit type 1 TsaB [Levilactobacillus brevis]ATU69819.1 tRNA (adenosine(37)-N6)-threonylcarbamoyltransferase complex dimerization subunit type 1 TsaB [Levilactobacillus brevis]ERK41226.1 universal bacterial protein YeaZ [Levilactobacillus brevis ATCC 14869 = DSM 20054]KIO98178.1 TsaB protein, required for threonylcarbamoyladenosine (t(6)A) formation in tRNA [Levilactobacillus brevis]KRK19847.1 metal-dependent protease
MKILAIDTSNRPLSVAVLDDTTVLAAITVTVHQKHAEYLLPEIERLLAMAALKPGDLDRVVVAAGPGSYTGIRIAVTTAKTLAATLDLDLVAVSSLATLAANVPVEGALVAPIFDARNQNVFAGLYRIKAGMPVPVIADAHVNITTFLTAVTEYAEPVWFLGDAAHFDDLINTTVSAATPGVSPWMNLPQAATIGLLGQQLSPVTDVDRFVPNYLRLTQAEAEWRAKNPNEDTESYVEKI